MRNPNFSSHSSFVSPSTSNIFACRFLSWILTEPPPSSTPLRTMSYASALTASGSVSSRSSWSSFGQVNGWCIALRLWSSSSSSNIGKSTTQSRLYWLSSRSPSLLAHSLLRNPSESYVTFALSEQIKIRSPVFASNTFAISASSSCEKNLSTDDLNSPSFTLIHTRPFAP